MPQIFKALATILAWVLWISSLVTGLSTLLMGIIAGGLYSSQPPMVIPVFFLVSVAHGVGAVVVMILRKKME